MKNVKKLLAVLLAAALCLSLAACYSENNTWAAKDGDETLPIGSYIYFLNNAFTEARSEVPEGTEILKTNIGEVSSRDWIQDRAVNYVKSYFYLKNQLKGLGQELDADELEEAGSTTDYLWTYYKSQMEGMGIAKESLNKAYSVYGAMYTKYFDALYGEGGEKEVAEEDIHNYFNDNYVYYDRFYVNLSSTDDEGNTVDLTDEEKTKLKSQLEAAVEKIQGGDDMESVALALFQERDGEDATSTYTAATPSQKESITDEALKAALEQYGEDKVFLVEAPTAYYVVHKLPISQGYADIQDDESQISTILHSLKDDEYEEYVRQQGAAFEGVTLNPDGMAKVDWSKFVTDDNKMGTKAAESSESSETEGSSEAESSAESSAE